MIELNEHTGFYMGRLINYNNSVYRNDCVPVAVGNYLITKDIPRDIIKNIVNSLYTHNEYNVITGGFDLSSVPKSIETCIRKYLKLDINVELYLHGASDISIENKHHVKSFNGHRDISTPCIVITHHENTFENHFWVVTLDDSVTIKIDNDGKKHTNIPPIVGYIEFQNFPIQN